MTRGAWMCRQYDDDSLKIWFAPRENEKPFTDSERAQKWRLSLASLLFFTVLLSDHLWFCAEGTTTITTTTITTTLPPTMADRFPPKSLSQGKKAIFLGNSTKPSWRLETCFPHHHYHHHHHHHNHTQPAHSNLRNFYLSFCNTYTLWDLFSGFSNPDTYNCSREVVQSGDGAGCRECIQAYQTYDLHAQEKYQEFEVLLQKYLQSDEYSVKACSEDCKVGTRLAMRFFPFSGRHSSPSHLAVMWLVPQVDCQLVPNNGEVVRFTMSFLLLEMLFFIIFYSYCYAGCCSPEWSILGLSCHCAVSEEASLLPQPDHQIHCNRCCHLSRYLLLVQRLIQEVAVWSKHPQCGEWVYLKQSSFACVLFFCGRRWRIQMLGCSYHCYYF
uniref:Family with sequence similarity 155 member A n=1 Tax=Leptobrachium leishanense TaxID=445787 RepID=A0A8C5LS05_9ANUR